MKLQIISTVVLIALLSSCSISKFRYLDSGEQEHDIEKPDVRVTYQLKPDDLLYIDFNSIDEESIAIFKKTGFGQQGNRSQNQLQNTNNMNWDLIGYRMDENGDIELPLIGKVTLDGLSLLQATDTLQTLVRKYIPDAIAEVKLLSFDVEMMGEFNTPGKVNTRQNYFTIMEAINKAGGISFGGNWRKVHVIRETENGRKDYYIDITKRDVMWTEKFYLQPHDVVYVESRPMSLARININDFTFVLTTITSIITTGVLLVTLSK